MSSAASSDVRSRQKPKSMTAPTTHASSSGFLCVGTLPCKTAARGLGSLPKSICRGPTNHTGSHLLGSSLQQSSFRPRTFHSRGIPKRKMCLNDANLGCASLAILGFGVALIVDHAQFYQILAGIFLRTGGQLTTLCQRSHGRIILTLAHLILSINGEQLNLDHHFMRDPSP